MTELQVTINNLKEVCIAAEMVLEKLEKAQKDLEKPPSHKWRHGDVFRNYLGVAMVYIKPATAPPQVFCLSSCIGHGGEKTYLINAKFLFNIKEKL